MAMYTNFNKIVERKDDKGKSYLLYSFTMATDGTPFSSRPALLSEARVKELLKKREGGPKFIFEGALQTGKAYKREKAKREKREARAAEKAAQSGPDPK